MDIIMDEITSETLAELEKTQKDFWNIPRKTGVLINTFIKMMNIQGLMKQAQMMQKKMEEEQAKLAQEIIEGNSGGGMVKVSLNGKFEMKKLSIDKSLINTDDAEILEDLIVAAFNDAKNKVDNKMQESMSAMTGGLNLGGLKLPF